MPLPLYSRANTVIFDSIRRWSEYVLPNSCNAMHSVLFFSLVSLERFFFILIMSTCPQIVFGSSLSWIFCQFSRTFYDASHNLLLAFDMIFFGLFFLNFCLLHNLSLVHFTRFFLFFIIGLIAVGRLNFVVLNLDN